MEAGDITEVVAIDGPAGAGKSTVARRVAERLGYRFLDTGAMYRAATWRALHLETPFDDVEGLEAVARDMNLAMNEQTIRVDGTDVTEAIRTPEVTRHIHYLADQPGVREVMAAQQRRIAAQAPTVAEGRDMGTIVFPNARCKIFLEASPEERAKRRAEEFEAKGESVDIDALAQEIRERDERDRNRTAAPLIAADDAVIVDTTDMTIDETVDAIVAIVEGSQ
jgi:CMP/dCMP kinase